uniref:Transposase n=1 Tax=Steinernema glaseri TaxID=37863 RepID=A0A1I7Y905_9BILA
MPEAPYRDSISLDFRIRPFFVQLALLETFAPHNTGLRLHHGRNPRSWQDRLRRQLLPDVRRLLLPLQQTLAHAGPDQPSADKHRRREHRGKALQKPLLCDRRRRGRQTRGQVVYGGRLTYSPSGTLFGVLLLVGR